MTPEELLQLVPEPIELWLNGRHSFDKGILILTAEQVIFANERGQLQHWDRTAITHCSVTDLLNRSEIMFRIEGAFLQERIEAQTIDAERFAAALSVDEDRSKNPSLSSPVSVSFTPVTVSETTAESAPLTDHWRGHLNALREMELINEDEFQTIQQRALTDSSSLESPPTQDNDEPQDNSDIARFIREQEKSLSASHTWPLTLGCFSGLAVFAGSIGVSVIYEISLCAGISVASVGLFVAFFLIGIAIEPSNRTHYNRIIKPLIESFLLREDMNFVDFVDYAGTVLEADSDFLKILRKDAGMEAPETKTD